MEDFHFPKMMNRAAVVSKKRLSQDQVQVLEAHFRVSKKLDPERKFELAVQLGVPPRQVAVWYQNKRARDKTLGMEVGCLQLRAELESVVAENARLVGEVNRLKAELSRARWKA